MSHCGPGNTPPVDMSSYEDSRLSWQYWLGRGRYGLLTKFVGSFNFYPLNSDDL